MAGSYKNVICSIFLRKPNSLFALCYNLLTFRWPALQTAHYQPALAPNDPHIEHAYAHMHTDTHVHTEHKARTNATMSFYTKYTFTLMFTHADTKMISLNLFHFISHTTTLFPTSPSCSNLSLLL